ncbi:DUF7673 family protein [Marinobacterium stanieri]|uniref:DUF7673 domain-containing protein n=1 Tax=Marinobacterium stanieri TaxID=49186 RepID=A0A1N6XCY3_9GAMM|nr:hypothetical protein SAMN05421647_11386 [Marinobacterium stanieri]
MDPNYSASVKLLLDYALNQSGSGASTAAQVLLSTYNSYNYHVALVDLTLLDEKGYNAALSVIRGRAESRMEPHSVIENGDDLFEKLESRWRHLGTGFRHRDLYIRKPIIQWQCPDCGAITDDYAHGPYPGRIDGRPVCDSWSDAHPEDEYSVMSPLAPK